MSLLIGQPLDARQFEQATGLWSAERFASLCDALTWAVSGRQFPGLPSLTGRVSSPDDGVDAEWQVEIPLDERTLPSPIVGPGLNVFQYKKRDLIAQDRRRIIANLKSDLKGAVASLARATGRHPDRYILFLNVDLKHDQARALKNAILEAYNRSYDVHVEIVAAGELAALLNNHPHLRAAYFAPVSFRTWSEADRSHRVQKLFRLDVDFVGREEELKRLRSFLDDSRVHAIVITGPHDIGKSRLALEATKHRPQDVVFALDPRSMKLEDYRDLAGHGETICVVEDPDPDSIESLVAEILGVSGLKMIVTLPTQAQAPAPFYGRDERIQSVHLERLSDQESRRLLTAIGKHLDYGIESWILDRAGGNPGILLAAASVGERLRGESVDFAEAVGREFEKRIEAELGEEPLKCAELLSCLTHVGISGKFESELKVISDVFGEGWQPPKVLVTLRDLEEAGLAKRGGSFAEISIPILANYLMAKLLRGRKHEVFALFGRLKDPGRLRFLRRLSQVRGQEVEAFWDALFGTDGPLASLRSALDHAHMLQLIAGTVPERTMRLLEGTLKRMSLEDRFAIVDDRRRELMWALEELLFRKKTSAAALRCLAMLAEAETDNYYSNNATGVFCESFHPLHPQLPLPLRDRLDILRSFFSSEHSIELRLIGVKAITSGLRGQAAIFLRSSSGLEPLDSRPQMTYGDVWDYIEGLVDLLMNLAQSGEPALAKAANAALPDAIAQCAIQGRPEVAVSRFKVVTDWMHTHRVPIPIADLAEALRVARDVLDGRRKDAGEDIAARLQEYVEQIDTLISGLDKDDFESRLKRWAGKWTRYDHDHELEEHGGRVYRGEKELAALAEEAVRDPRTLTDDLLTWLCSEEAKKAHMFFWSLGKVDSERKWLPKIEQIGAHKSGAIAFSAYFGGLGKHFRSFVSNRLDELTDARDVAAEAIVNATGNLGGDLAGVERMERLIQERRVDPVYVERVLTCGGWIESLNGKQYLRLVKAIAGENMENAVAVIDFLGMWLHTERPIDGELAELSWQCLEAKPAIRSDDVYDCDKLASKLAQLDPERGFKLLEKLLTQPYDTRSWNPIDRYGVRENEFWNVLRKADRERALRVVLSSALADPLRRMRVTWDLREVIDQESDADVLIAIAVESERQAELVCECITTAKSGFWPVALTIIEKYPNNEEIQGALAAGITQMGTVITGPMSLHFESCRKEVERVLEDSVTPTAARPWLRDVLSRLEGEVARQIVWEYDEDVNSLRRYIQDKDSPERIWAIGRVLKYAELKDMRKLLTVEDIAEALPQVDLPPKKRRALEKALEVWQVER